MIFQHSDDSISRLECQGSCQVPCHQDDAVISVLACTIQALPVRPQIKLDQPELPLPAGVMLANKQGQCAFRITRMSFEMPETSTVLGQSFQVCAGSCSIYWLFEASAGPCQASIAVSCRSFKLAFGSKAGGSQGQISRYSAQSL